jgi:hypothetical protein
MNEATNHITRLDYCQFLLSSQINYTLTYFADHSDKHNHDEVNRYLRDDKLTPRLLWEQARGDIVLSGNGFLLFDDTVADKNYSFAIELVRRQYSGNAKAIIKGIGIVTCVYVNPDTEQFWLIDYRIFDKNGDGKSKLDHVQEMFDHARLVKQLPFRTVLMDSWYAARWLMLHFERHGKLYYCPLKDNRQVDEGDGTQSCYQRVDSLSWSQDELLHGKDIHVKDFPKGHRLHLFRLVLSTQRTDYVVTNDVTQTTTDGTQKVCVVRWRIEQVHREAKQVTGLEACQCRKARIQRNHIACCFLVWYRLKELAYATGRTLYQIKYGQLDDYMVAQLRNPSVPMVLA